MDGKMWEVLLDKGGVRKSKLLKLAKFVSFNNLLYLVMKIYTKKKGEEKNEIETFWEEISYNSIIIIFNFQ